MKTEVILHRGLQDFEVMQRSKSGMFNATHLAKQWNLSNPNSVKEVKEFFKLKSTSELINSIVEQENLKGENSTYLKSRGKYNGGTWMHPILFIDFAMWLNPKFKYHVLKWVSDNLLAFRNDAGDNFKAMMNAYQSIGGKEYARLAKAINHVVFGSHKRDIRNAADEDKLKELIQLQSTLTFNIDMGIINSEEELMAMLRKLYARKRTPKCLA